MADDEADPGIQLPSGDPEAIRSQAAAMERTAEAMRLMSSALSDPDRALVMSDAQWLALAAELEVAERELAESTATGTGESVYGEGPLGGAVEQLLERMAAGVADQRRGLDELWAEARRQRPNN